MRADLRLEGWLTLAVGAVFTAVAAGSLALVAGCVADPSCLPQAGSFDLSGIFALLVAGVAAVCGGVWVLRNLKAAATQSP